MFAIYFLFIFNQEILKNNLSEYFIKNITVSGLVLDRESDKNKVSTAATGFGMYAWAIMAEEGKITKKEAILKVKTSFRFIIKNNPKKNRGWVWHFLYSNGSPYPNSEVSTIDTAIFYLGAQRAAQMLGDEGFAWEVEGEISRVDTEWLMKGQYLRHGFKWKENGECEFIDVAWDNYSEGIMIYRLFHIPYNPKETRFDLPLFVYYYPLCFFDEPRMVDNLKKAVLFQQEKYNIWGISSNDSENNGYQFFDENIISPLTVLGLTAYLKLEKTQNLDTKQCILFPAEYECVQSKSRLTKWQSRDFIGIDVGSAYILTWKGKGKNGESVTISP